MQRQLPGGTSPFNPEPRPNAFSQQGPSDTIARRGESCFWFRFQPCPCPDEKKTSACRTCAPHTGFIKSIQSTVEIEGEKPIVSGVYVTPRWVPVTGVQRLFYKDRGREIYPDVVRVERDRIQLSAPLQNWRAVYLDYSVSLVEEDLAVVEAKGRTRVDLALDGRRLVVAILAVHDAAGAPVEFSGHTFDSLLLRKPHVGQLRVSFRAANPTAIGYRTFDLQETDFRPRRVTIRLEEGEISLVVDHSVKMGEGDIITLLQSDIRAQQNITGGSDGIDRLMYGPVKAIMNVWGLPDANQPLREYREYREGVDFVLNDYESIRWITPRPLGGATIMYLYHPSFRVTGPVTIGSGGNRNAPRMYRARAISSYGALSGAIRGQ